jgi:hypothetical protein
VGDRGQRVAGLTCNPVSAIRWMLLLAYPKAFQRGRTGWTSPARSWARASTRCSPAASWKLPDQRVKPDGSGAELRVAGCHEPPATRNSTAATPSQPAQATPDTSTGPAAISACASGVRMSELTRNSCSGLAFQLVILSLDRAREWAVEVSIRRSHLTDATP